MRLGALFATLILFFTCTAYAELTSEQQQAKAHGLMLYNQFKAISAKPFLEIAAEAGDRESQFFLAEALVKKGRYMTAEAYKWYEAAANQGDLYSMLRLSRTDNDLCSIMNNCPSSTKTPLDWLKQARAIAGVNAEKGDAEAMYVMYLATAELEWLEKSAEAGYAQGQWLLANRYQEGEGFFFLPGNRKESYEKWIKASAEGGNPKAMMAYVGILYKKGDMETARHWITKAAETGFESGVTSLGAYSGHAPAKFGFPLDVVKGYGLISLLRELDGGGNVQVYVDEVLPEIAAKMTPEQIEQAKVFAKEWKATHPPLSFFPDKLGY
ncbi:sel1 repeat family protein [Pseudomonas sp. AA-38]|uniref:tetratricopeptide repeat protein n=1 Tax=Pseudomonas sp. AA-38 TaxID=3028807 RepID=UPI0023F68AFC|nr:sel1 repeat family protein [Pseudomonas sp. AA-38]